ncbi:MAG TPA: PadR family transcriptional regulator [Gemmatimonadaceae bacterium]|jgi:transcriptional regulator
MSDAESDLLRSSLDLLILKSLTWGPLHGYAIAEWIEATSKTVLLLEEGTLYPALHRLERHGWIAAEWGVSETNRRAKFYRLTAAGRARYRAESRVWHRHADAIAATLRAVADDQ